MKQYHLVRLGGLLLAACLVICAAALPKVSAEAAPSLSFAQSVQTASHVLVPAAPGTDVKKNNYAVLDCSNTAKGYFMVKYTGSASRIKVRVAKDSLTYTYDLNTSGNYEVFPVSEGNGSYKVTVLENIEGNKYVQVFSETVEVKLENEFAPFLVPNQYVNFNADSKTVKKADELASKAKDDLSVVKEVYTYTINNIVYDTQKASSVSSGYLPNVDSVLDAKKGICFDYAAVMTAMLRSQGIPCKLVVGYSGTVYHAWINVYLKNSGWVNAAIYFDGTSWKLMDPTFASSSKSSDSIMKYIGDASNYQKKYVY